ncbi:MAG: 2-iminoacetate synthase ThiH [Bacillota bacterium]
MGFEKQLHQYDSFDILQYLNGVKENDVLRILEKRKLDALEFLALLSPAAGNLLETMAQKAHEISIKHFGKTILLYTPMYLSNFCVNQCIYCSFNFDLNIPRRKLTFDEIEEEAKAISDTGLKHILILTGESRRETPVSYLTEAVKRLKKYFQSISIEIYPLELEEYRMMAAAGVDGLTIYQEVYDKQVYRQVHIGGPKTNYLFRLNAPERACKAKFRSVNIGALLGLAQWQREAFFTGLHAQYLQNQYPDVEISISLPRIRPHAGGFKGRVKVEDRALVQILLALRLFLPYAGITISTRESRFLRDHLIPLGVTKMSAGVSTAVGGHTSDKGTDQFEIGDTRSVAEMKEVILKKGYQPILKDWMKWD